MKVEIKIRTRVETSKTLNIDFPLCLKRCAYHDGGGWFETWIRLDASGQEHKININDRDEWQFHVSAPVLASALGYYLEEAKFDYEIVPADQFYAKLAEFKAALDGVPPATATASLDMVEGGKR